MGLKATHSHFFEGFEHQILFYGHIIIWVRTATDMTYLCPIEVSANGLYWHGRWLCRFILSSSSYIVVESHLNWGAAREAGEMLMKNTHVFLRCWGSAKPSAAAVSVLLLSAKDLRTARKRWVQPRLQSTQRGGAGHEHFIKLFSFFISYSSKAEEKSAFDSSPPGLSWAGGPSVLFVFFVVRHVCGLDLVCGVVKHLH